MLTNYENQVTCHGGEMLEHLYFDKHKISHINGSM